MDSLKLPSPTAAVGRTETIVRGLKSRRTDHATRRQVYGLALPQSTDEEEGDVHSQERRNSNEQQRPESCKHRHPPSLQVHQRRTNLYRTLATDRLWPQASFVRLLAQAVRVLPQPGARFERFDQRPMPATITSVGNDTKIPKHIAR